MRKIALDIGDVRIGIATSDPLGIIASGYETYVRKNSDDDFRYISKLCKEKEADTIVIGLPINMDGTSGIRVQIVRDFGTKLKTFIEEQIKIAYLDERLTTVQAERMLISSGVRRDDRKKIIDKVAATIILQTYLN